MTLADGSRLGRYEIRSPLGAGGMGEVYRARDPQLDRDVAIKVLPADVATDPERLRRFEQEARAASALNHPGILTVLDIGYHDSSPFLVMELLEGQTLREALRGGALPLEAALDFGAQMAGALAAAHDKQIIHRDLKPENLFLCRDGRIKILDFGLAKLRQPTPSQSQMSQAPTLDQPATTPGTVMGTVGYMAPEQIRAQPVDARSDLFALGCVLYEMICGRRAFSGPTAADVISAVLKEEPPSLPSAGAQAPEPLQRVIERCLAKRSKDRFQSARDLAFALDAATRGEAASHTPPSPGKSRWPRLLAPAALLLVVGALAALLYLLGETRRGPAGTPSGHSLAVLPLEDLSASRSEEHLADGMTEALITRLAQVRALRVISRTSVMRFKGARKPLPEIARELGVDSIVEGSVQRAGNRVRITAQLIQARTDSHVWAEEYERELTEILSLQAEVARAIAREVAVQVRPDEARRLSAAQAVNPEVYELVLRGRFQWNKRSDEALAKAEELFREAVRRDPTYAPGHAGLADVALTRFDYGSSTWEESMAEAQAATRRALELDDELAASHTSLAHIHLHGWRWEDAEREFRRAIDLDPSYVVAHHWYALCLTSLGRVDEAVEAMRQAQRLDPLSIRVNADLGMAYLAARRYEEAVAQEDKTLELDPKASGPRWIKGMALGQLGRYDQAVAEITAVLESNPDGAHLLGSLGHVHALAGRPAEARRVLGRLLELSSREDVTFFVALIYAGLGEKQPALDWLEKAVAARSGSIRYLKVEPRLDTLREEPRYRKLMQQVGLAP